MKKLKIGVVGAGYWGSNLIAALAKLGCPPTIICDKSADNLTRQKTRHPAIGQTFDFPHTLNGINLDAVVIATPAGMHFPMAKKALLAGKHVFVEKPMAMTVEDCAELITLAEERGLILMVGHTFLYSPAVRAAKEIVDTGEIGRIMHISSRRLNLGAFQPDVNVLWDLAPHDLSIVLALMEEQPVAVSSFGGAHRVHEGLEDIAGISLTFSGGRTALIQNSWLYPEKVRDMAIIGERGMILYDDVRAEEKIRVYDRSVTAPNGGGSPKASYQYHRGELHSPEIATDEPLQVEMAHFLDCIDAGARSLSSGHEGLEVVRILDAASRSLRERREISLHGLPRRRVLVPGLRAKQPVLA